MERMEIKAKVLGKWVKGTIFKKAMLSLDFGDEFEPRYYDLPVSRAFWYAANVGYSINVTMELKEDGFWYPV